MKEHKHIFQRFSFFFACLMTPTLTMAQTTGQYLLQQFNGTTHVERYLSPGATTIMAFDGSGLPITINQSYFQTASGLNGILADPSTNGSFSASAWRVDLSVPSHSDITSYFTDPANHGSFSAANWRSRLSVYTKAETDNFFALPSSNIGFDDAAWRSDLSLEIGEDVQAYSLNLDDLADGSLTGSKVGTGIDADNITAGTLPAARMSWLGTNMATFLGTPSSANLRATLTDEVGSGAAYFLGGALGTPASATLTNATNLPISTGVSGLGSGMAAFLATPSSANLASAVTGETGSGSLVFGSSPSFTGTTSVVTTSGEQVWLSMGNATFPDELVISSRAATTNSGYRTWIMKNAANEGAAIEAQGANGGIKIYGNYNLGLVLFSGGYGGYTDIHSPVGGSYGIRFFPSGNQVLEIGEWGAKLLKVDSAPASVDQCAFLYVLENAGSAELFVKDEAGNETQISPHACDAPEWLADDDSYGPDRIVRECQYYTGIIRWTNESRRARLFERLLAGEDLSHTPAQSRQIVYKETFDAFKVRTGIALKKLDWDATQMEQVKAREEEMHRWESGSTVSSTSNTSAKGASVDTAAGRSEGTQAPPVLQHTPKPQRLDPKPRPVWLKKGR